MTSDDPKEIVEFSRGIVPGSERKKAGRKRAKRAPVTTGNHVPERAANPTKQSSRHLRPRTAEDIANEQTAEQLALRIWAAMVAQKVLSGMSALMDELPPYILSTAALKSLQRITSQGNDMSDWLHNLPVLWMSVLVFGFTYLVTAGIYAVITVFAVGERARSFKAISPGLLPPLGIIFGLFVVFTAAQVWTDNEKAKAEIDREASALRSVEILVTSFPTETQVQLRELVRRYIADVVAQEWPLMAQGTANLRAIPGVLAEALQATLALNPSSEGQKTAQRHIATALETALDARRQRIIISESQVNLVKWACLFMQALCALVAIAMVHSDNRLASIIAMGIFATGVAASIFLILAHDRPFIGELSIKPDPLLQVMPEIASSR